MVLRDGNNAAFLGLYERYTPRLLRFVCRISGNADDMFLEDLVQETWVRSMTVLHRFDWGSTLATWLHGIALNVTREAVRREHRFGVADADEAAIADVTTSSVERSHEERIDLEEVQRTGSEHARAIVQLVDALDQVDAVMLGRAQEIYLAARRASESIRRRSSPELMRQPGANRRRFRSHP